MAWQRTGNPEEELHACRSKPARSACLPSPYSPQPKATNTHICYACVIQPKAAHMMLCMGSSVWPGNAPHRKSRRGATRVPFKAGPLCPSPVSSYSHRQLTHMMLCMGSSGLQRQQQKNMHCIGTPQQSPEEELHACAVQGRPALLPVSRLRLYQQPSGVVGCHVLVVF